MKRVLATFGVGGLLAGLVVMAVPAESGATKSDATLVNDEIVVASLDPTGLPIESQIISRLASNGGEQRTVLDPTSTANVQYLNQRGRPDITSDGIQVEVGGPEPQVILTQAIVDKPMPLAMHAQYTLDGEIVDPMNLLDANGSTGISYTITNIDTKEKKVSYKEADGTKKTEKVPVFAPLVGTLTTTVPRDWEITDTGKAAVTTDAAGDTVLTWSLVLYPPLGDYTQTVKFGAVMDRGSIPQTVLSAAPIRTSQDPAAAFSTSLLESSIEGNDSLASGVDQLNDQTLALATAASQLSDGITAAADGTEEASAGVSDVLVPGTQGVAEGNKALAEGTAGVAEGATGLADASTDLAKATNELARGMPELTDAASEITKGAEELAAAVGSPTDPPLPRPTPTTTPTPGTLPTPSPSGQPIFPTPTSSPTAPITLEQAVRATTAAAQDLRLSLITHSNSLQETYRGMVKVQIQFCLPPPPAPPVTDPRCDEFQEQMDALQQNVGQAYFNALGGEAVYVSLRGIQLSVDELSIALAGSEQPPQEGLVQALKALSAGIDATAEGVTGIDTGTEAVAEGGDELAKASKDVASGSEDLAELSSEVAFGTEEVATGLALLVPGIDEAAEGSAALATGSTDLQTQGTAELYNTIIETSDEPAQASAYLTASNKRAATALPYGAPEGAVGNAAYLMTMEAVVPNDTSPWILLAVGLIFVAAIAGAVLKQLSSSRGAG